MEYRQDYHAERIRRVLKRRRKILREKALSLEQGVNVPSVEDCEFLTKEIIDRYKVDMKLGINLRERCLFNSRFSKKVRRTREETIDEIKKAIDEGAKSIDEISEMIGIKPLTIYNYYRKKVELPKFEKRLLDYQGEYYSPKINPIIDSLIEAGANLEEITEELESIGMKKYSREWINQYTLRTGQHEKWKNARAKVGCKRARDFYLGKIASQIKEIEKRKYREECPWAYKKTEKFFFAINGRHDYEKVFSFLKHYQTAKENGERISLEEFGEEHGLSFTYVGKILKTVGEKPLIKPHQKIRELVPEYKRQALERAAEIPMSGENLAYFLGLSRGVVSRHYTNFSARKRSKIEEYVARFGSGKNLSYLTYRLASQIYEAVDEEEEEEGGCGFSREDTLEVLGCSERVYDYAVEHRDEIEPVIVNALKVLYPDKKIDKPFGRLK